MSEVDALVKECVAESREHVDQLERDLVRLENHPSSRDTLASIFRTVHTIKGAAGFTGLPTLARLAHSGESVLSRLRDGALVLTPAVTSGLLALADGLREILSHVDRTGHEGELDCAAIVDRLERLRDGGALGDHTPAGSGPDGGGTGPLIPAAGTVRVSVEQLDQLMNLVGELVLARNEMVQLGAVQENPVLLGTSQRLNSISTRLREGIMKTRMQPIDNVWNKLPRVMRDCAQQCGKLVRLEMEGRDTELDRTLIEAIQDPLAHLVRNAVDHGLEAPERRIAAGKPAEGRLVLHAFHQNGQVTIDVSDDGGGVDVASIKSRAIERGLLTPDQARGMSEQEAATLIFLPGLSTATQVTGISGRGVGMDVVKTNIERIGGKVSVHSRAGVGTTLTMRIPLTLAIVTALIVRNGDDGYAIPQVNVIELVRLDAEDARRGIEWIQDAAVYRLRGELLPVVWLKAEMAPGPRIRTAARAGFPRDEAVNIIVLGVDRHRFGLVVDDVSDMQEIVVKPLGRHVRGIPVFAGATITGNGRVVLILDVPGLAQRAGLLSEERDRASTSPDAPIEETRENQAALLLLAGPDDAQMAVPLSQIARLEQFSRSSLEYIAGQAVTQYVGDILPLESLADFLADPGGRRTPPLASDAPVQAIIYSKNGTRVGLVVNRILDTVEHRLDGLRPSTRRGVVGSIVIRERVTELLDLDAICAGLTAAALARHRPAGRGM